HTAKDAQRFTETVRSGRGEVIFGADFITGFPTETDEMFENTISQVKDCGISFLHVFPYSSRDGTPAARMPQVPAEVRKDRARRLRQAGKLAELDLFDRLVGKTDRVLVEKTGNDGLWLGHTEGFAPIRVSGDLKPGEIVPVRILPTHQQGLLGEIIDG
ncbi:MAG: TRAM domain-containing protein, partial [Sphingomonadales bacterium]